MLRRLRQRYAWWIAFLTFQIVHDTRRDGAS